DGGDAARATDPRPRIVVLHVIRRGADCYPLRAAQRGGAGHALLLLGDGVYNATPGGVPAYFASECARARRVTPGGAITVDDAEVVELILRAGKVVGW